jgi:hypothetical protein
MPYFCKLQGEHPRAGIYESGQLMLLPLASLAQLWLLLRFSTNPTVTETITMVNSMNGFTHTTRTQIVAYARKIDAGICLIKLPELQVSWVDTVVFN